MVRAAEPLLRSVPFQRNVIEHRPGGGAVRVNTARLDGRGAMAIVRGAKRARNSSAELFVVGSLIESIYTCSKLKTVVAPTESHLPCLNYSIIILTPTTLQLTLRVVVTKSV